MFLYDLFVTTILSCIGMYFQGGFMAIADVQEKGSWIYVYDEKNKEISHMSASNRQVLGVASDFFVVIQGSWIYIYDEKCKEISHMSSSGKEVKGAAGSSFTVKQGSWIYIYDKNCKEQSHRSA